ncbi:MAG: DNA repair protein [Crocosphaera sp.]|nr:DNA repair protein [Crocosphaera sp.]
MSNQHQHNVLTILLMRFEVQPSEGIKIGKQWLEEHPQSNWGTILRLLKNNQLQVVEKSLKLIEPSAQTSPSKIVHKYRGVEIQPKPTSTIKDIKEQNSDKKRQYRGVKY